MGRKDSTMDAERSTMFRLLPGISDIVPLEAKDEDKGNCEAGRSIAAPQQMTNLRSRAEAQPLQRRRR